MDIVESVKMATTTLLANKLRSSLTMLGYYHWQRLGDCNGRTGAQKLAAEQFESFGPNVLFVTGTRQARIQRLTCQNFSAS